MIFKYTEIEDLQNNEWATKSKPFRDIKSIHLIAVDAVFHDLNTGFTIETDGDECNKFSDDSSLTYWSGNKCFVDGDITKVYINSTWYILRRMYITERDSIVVVVSKPKDIWQEADKLILELEELPEIYFAVFY